MQMCNRKMFIPNIDEKAPVWAIQIIIWSDASGGSLVSHGHGAGCVIFPSFGKLYDGKRMDRKLTDLELFGQLIGICAGSEMLRNQTAVGKVDNPGSVQIFGKGYSTSCNFEIRLVPRAILKWIDNCILGEGKLDLRIYSKDT